MELQTTKQINIDVSKHKYISLDAKQYDRNLRFILITCYRDGALLPINKNTCFASIRYRKPDEYGVFNTCEITSDGKILVELTEQMLSVAGTCYADVVIHENMNLSVNIVENADNTVEIIDTGNSGIISTMTFIVYVHESAFDNIEIESSYEYNALNDALIENRRNYASVMESCNTSETNAKDSEINAKTSETNAKKSETAAKTSETNAKKSETASSVSEDNAKTSEINAKESEVNAATSETNANASEVASKTSEINAKESEVNAKTSETNAKDSEVNAKTSEANALNSANLAQSYAVGGTATRDGEDEDNALFYYNESLKNAKSADESETKALEYRNLSQSYAVGGTGIEERPDEATDNAKWYCEQSSQRADAADKSATAAATSEGEALKSQQAASESAKAADESAKAAKTSEGIAVENAQTIKNIADNLVGGFIPNGTVAFEDLANVEKITGYTYNISNDFVTTDDFREGAGVEYSAGTNVYWTNSDEWDCLGGAATPIATVDEVKNYLGI